MDINVQNDDLTDCEENGEESARAKKYTIEDFIKNETVMELNEKENLWKMN